MLVGFQIRNRFRAGHKYLLVSYDDYHAVEFAVVVCVSIAFGVDVELDHSAGFFFALVGFALLAGGEGHACYRWDGGEG